MALSVTQQVSNILSAQTEQIAQVLSLPLSAFQKQDCSQSSLKGPRNELPQPSVVQGANLARNPSTVITSQKDTSKETVSPTPIAQSTPQVSIPSVSVASKGQPSYSNSGTDTELEMDLEFPAASTRRPDSKRAPYTILQPAASPTESRSKNKKSQSEIKIKESILEVAMAAIHSP